MQINFEANSIQTGGTGISQVNEYNISWPNLEQELAVLRRKTAGDPQLSLAVTELEAAVKKQNAPGIMGTIRKYAAEFSTAAFANLAGAGVLELIKSFLA